MFHSKKLFSYIPSLLLIFSLTGCNEKKSNDLTVHWDRDMCSRCVMVVSDRQNTVQVISTKTGKKSVFDDIGCMVIWSQVEKNYLNTKDKIWVNDVITGEWIDAKKAFYDEDNVTPMGYGFSAHKLESDIAKDKDSLSYKQITKRILMRKM